MDLNYYYIFLDAEAFSFQFSFVSFENMKVPGYVSVYRLLKKNKKKMSN